MNRSDGNPAMFQHCEKVYRAMLEEAEPHEENEDLAVFTGFTTHLFEELDLSVPYYSKITRLLKDMDCIRQIKRGGSTTPSQWLLVQAPTMELYKYVDGDIITPSRTTMLEQQIADLRGMVQDHERRLTEAGI